MKTFNTVLYKVLSPQNVGMIIRSHVAFGGKYLIFIGYDKPWTFKPGTQGFSRKLEKGCVIENFPDSDDFFEWSKRNGFVNIAIEISDSAISLTDYKFPDTCNLIVGNEGAGIPTDFLKKCDDTVYIPQFGKVECLNVAVSASIVLFDFAKNNRNMNLIEGSKYVV